MSIQVMDAILSRWFLDAKFRQQLRDDPEQALVGYNVSPAHRARLLKLKKYEQNPVSTQHTDLVGLK